MQLKASRGSCCVSLSEHSGLEALKALSIHLQMKLFTEAYAILLHINP